MYFLFQTKITLKIVGEDAVKELQAQAEAKGLVAAIVRDAGKQTGIICWILQLFMSFLFYSQHIWPNLNVPVSNVDVLDPLLEVSLIKCSNRLLLQAITVYFNFTFSQVEPKLIREQSQS